MCSGNELAPDGDVCDENHAQNITALYIILPIARVETAAVKRVMAAAIESQNSSKQCHYSLPLMFSTLSFCPSDYSKSSDFDEFLRMSWG